MSSNDVWRAASPRNAAIWLTSLTVPWWVAGGWAIDPFVGRETRPHHDFDVGIFRHDVFAFIALLSSWEFLLRDSLAATSPHHPWLAALESV
jgi:hypothetical protein